ncbi:MAG: toll/interleukin-1 receptor domain-containing protein [Saprospiraceae bacterium]
MSSTRLFIAYSRKDADLLDELKIFLKPIVLKYNLSIWDDKEIDAGATWEAEIKKNLNSADIFLFLISADSLASDYFHDKELSFAIERHKKGEVKIIPIIMRSCGWKHSKIAELQVLPKDGKPVYSSHWSFKSEAYTDVVDGIEKVLLQKKVDGEKELRTAKEKQIEATKEAERLKKEKEQQKIQLEIAEKKKAEEAKERQEELNAWKKTKADNKITIYQKFIKQYPTSEFKEEARNKINLLRNKNKKTKQKNTPTKSLTTSLNLKTSPPVSNAATKFADQLEKQDAFFERAAIILERGFYASLPVIGAVSLTLFEKKFKIQLLKSILNIDLSSAAIILGIAIMLIYQLTLVAEDYTFITNEGTEMKETIWGIILTIISFGIISLLGVFILQMILGVSFV